MDGGQKVNIPLDSELDIKSSDMLVPVNEPKFQHNRQKFQGRYLPSSVRFEHDGYAAGNDVYEFDVSETSYYDEVNNVRVVRKVLNDNPTYEFRIMDVERNILGVLVFNASGSIKDYNTDTCEYIDGHVRGMFNGKPFDILFDKNAVQDIPVVSDDPLQHNSDIILDSVDNISGYLTNLRIFDDSARITLQFAGMLMPDDKIYNGSYLFGTFAKFMEDTSTWQCGSYTFNVVHGNGTYSINVKNKDGEVLALTNVSVTPDADSNSIAVGFRTNLKQSVDLYAKWIKVFPFFKDVYAVSPSNSYLLNYMADETVTYNRWTCDIVNDAVQQVNYGLQGRNQYLFWRDTAALLGNKKSLKKVIKHIFPMWIGIRSRYDSKYLSSDFLDTYNILSGTISLPYKNTTRTLGKIRLRSSTTPNSRRLQYYQSGKTSTEFNSAIWFGGNRIERNASDSYMEYQIHIGYTYYETTYDDPIWKIGQHTISIPMDEFKRLYFPIFNKDINLYKQEILDFFADMIKLEWTDGTTNFPAYELAYIFCVSFELVNNFNTGGMSELGRFIPSTQTHTALSSVVATYIFDYASTPNENSSLEDRVLQLSSATDVHVYYNGYDDELRHGVITEYPGARQNDVYTGSSFRVATLIGGLSEKTVTLDDGTIVWAACCRCCVLSELSIADDNPLNERLDATAFKIAPVPDAQYGLYDVNDCVNASVFFEHKLMSASCNDILSISVSLCSKDTDILLYYLPKGLIGNTIQDESEYMDIIPAHIYYDTLDSSKYLEELPLKMIAVRPKYSDRDTRDADTMLNILVNGTPAKMNDNTFFRVIEGVEDKLDADDLLPGNSFSEDLLPKFVRDTEFTTGDYGWWIDFMSFDASASDGDIIKGDKIVQQIAMYAKGSDPKFTATYGIVTGQISQPSVNNFTYDNKQMNISNLRYDSDLDGFKVDYTTPVEYALNVAVPLLADQNMQLVSFDNNIAVIDTVYNGSRYIRLNIDFDMHQVTVMESMDGGTTYSNARECDELWTGKTTVDITYDGAAYIVCLVNGIYSSKDISARDFVHPYISVACDGKQIQIPVDIGSSGIGCFYTDIRKKVLDRVQFAELKTDSELQFLKQAWDTTSRVENFWWIDDRHVFELTKDKFILREKTDVLDDWNGDRFTEDSDSCIIERSRVIDSSVQQYMCSSAYKESARFIAMSYETGNILLSIYDPLLKQDMTDDNNCLRIRLYINKHKLTASGTLLNVPGSVNTINLNTYSDIQPDILITQSKWSATCVDGRLIIGIHYDNNFNQWAVVINLNTGNVEKVIQGYGFVGVHGELTGGEIPTKWFDPEIGFIGAVKTIDSLGTADREYSIHRIDELWNVDSQIVGDDTQQWYIDKSISSIVSHLTYEGSGTFRVAELKLNNNYSVNYDSGSYISSVLSDMFLNAEPVEKLIPIKDTAWKVALVLWLYPVVYSISPRVSVINYLQQTLGQAAYVHYNSTSLTKQKGASQSEVIDNNAKYDLYAEEVERDNTKAVLAHTNSDEITFDKQQVKQRQSVDDPFTNALLLCAAALSSLSDFAQDNVKVDLEQKQLSVDFSKKGWSGYFEDNISSMKLSEMSMTSVNSTQTSEVTAVKSLDMFYSTSEKQNVKAGRGYVNHNFVAQCVVQSVESVQIQMMQQRFTLVIRELTMLPLQLLSKAGEAGLNAIGKQVEASAGENFFLVGLANGATIPLSPGLAIAYSAIELALEYTRIGMELVKSLVDAMGGGKLQTAVTARQSHKDYNIEHKHKYGSRTESFMYPCFGIDTPQVIKDESVEVVMQNKSWYMDVPTKLPRTQNATAVTDFVTHNVSNSVKDGFKGDIPYFTAMVKGIHRDVQLPDRMAYVIGAETFLPADDYKNRSVGESEPVFPTPPFQDYIVDDTWQLAQTASDSMTTWISCRDTKIIDGDYSNIVVSDDFCGVACPYAAIEVKRGIDKKYIRPWAITPNAVALNNTGMNCVYDEKIYHAFDGYGYRVVNWMGAPGMGKNHQTLMYSFLVNDRFKRGNKMPPNEFIGNFSGEPTVDIHGDSNDKVFTLATQPGEGAGLVTGTVGEDKDVRRYAIPVFSEFVNTMPAAVKTIAVQTLSVVDGITSLTTENRDLQTAYKAPVSIDFTIGKNKYRYTQEYICQVTQERGVTLVQDLVPCLGLTYLGSTPYEAYLYSQAERQYYVFTGNSALRKVDMIERFRNVINGRYDFVNQEVILPCVATFLRLDNKVKDDDDETDNTMVARLSDNKFLGEVQPPLDTIYNTRSGFRTVSVPSGIAFQGPNRCIINRFVVSDYMIDQIKANYGKWSRVPREEYHPFRTYKAKYERVDETIGDKVQVEGWTHNPFLLVTAPLGVSENVDCLFEWEITFCYPVEMEKLYGPDNYAVVNVQAETMTPGGKVVAERPVHIYLTKELFTRSDKYGYYSFRYQSRCGAGNRERLHIWSDQYICVSSLDLEYKPVTQRRTEILTQQVDVQRLTEI